MIDSDIVQSGGQVSQVEVPPITSSPILLPRASRATFWLLLFAFAYFMAVIFYFAGYGLVLGLTNPELAQTPDAIGQIIEEHAQGYGALVGMYAVQFILLVPLIILASHFSAQSWQETLALRPFRLRSLYFWLLVLCVFLAVQTLAERLLKIEPDSFVLLINDSKSIPLAILMVVLAPIMEEFLFRGYLFKAWRSSWLGLTGTLIVTSLLFTVLHWGQYQWILLVIIFIFSIILGLAREKTGSVWVPVILHSLNNLLFTILVVFLGIL
jgi:membrane protease YdiL (CAAX protease family)